MCNRLGMLSSHRNSLCFKDLNIFKNGIQSTALIKFSLTLLFVRLRIMPFRLNFESEGEEMPCTLPGGCTRKENNSLSFCLLLINPFSYFILLSLTCKVAFSPPLVSNELSRAGLMQKLWYRLCLFMLSLLLVQCQ